MTKHKYLLSITLVFIFFTHLHARGKIDLTPQWGNITPELFITDDLSLTIDDILTENYQKKFTHISKRRPVIPNKIYWHRVDFSNINFSPSDDWMVLFRNYYDITFFYQDGDSIAQQKQGTKWDKNSKKSINAVFYIKNDKLIDGRFLYARIIHNKRSAFIWKVAYTNEIVFELKNTFYTKKRFKEQLWYYIYIGALFIIIAYFFGIYFMYKDKLYILYLLYLLSLFLYLAPKAEYIEMLTYLYFEFFFRIFHELIQGAINIFYLLFATAFFKAKSDFPKLYVAINYAVKILIIIMVVQVILMYTDKYFYIETYIMRAERYLVMLFSFWAYYYILRHYKDKLIFFLLIGSFFYLLGGLSAIIFAQVGYMMLGSLLEVFLFSLGMGYRMKLVEEEKNRIEGEINRVQLTALRAQMNPHFIFNSLNSIRAYVISNKVREASLYLTKFAKLIRLILYYSAKENIRLSEELEALNLYVELEELRFRIDLGYTVSLDEKLSSQHIFVPPLILQPYVENAIRHGLAPLKSDKKLTITIAKERNRLVFSIKDNGVGRKFSQKMKENKQSGHKSMAMELTKRRINLIEQSQLRKDQVDVIDHYSDNKPSGTEVILRLPLLLNVETGKDENKDWNN